MSRGDAIAKFVCPGCGEVTVSTVCNSTPLSRRKRAPISDLTVKRWRRCLDCGWKFSTTESVDEPRALPKHRPDHPLLPI